MRPDIEMSVVLAATCQQVWAIVADPCSDPLWCPRVLDAVQTVGSGPGTGARYDSRHRPVPGPAAVQRVEITLWDPPSRRRSTSRTADGLLSVDYELTPVEQGCRFTERDSFHLAGSRRPARRLFVAVKRRRIRQQFDQLSRLLAAGPLGEVQDSGGRQ